MPKQMRYHSRCTSYSRNLTNFPLLGKLRGVSFWFLSSAYSVLTRRPHHLDDDGDSGEIRQNMTSKHDVWFNVFLLIESPIVCVFMSGVLKLYLEALRVIQNTRWTLWIERRKNKKLHAFVSQVLEKRLRDRGSETEESLSMRLHNAREEIAYGNVEVLLGHAMI